MTDLADVAQVVLDDLQGERFYVALVELRFFYWETDCSVASIAAGYTLPAHEVPGAAGPLVLASTCGWCGDNEVVHSRTERAERERWWRRRHEVRGRREVEVGWLPGDRCSNCNDGFAAWAEIDRARGARLDTSERQLLRSMPYSDYLLTEHWKKVRARALKYAGYRCQLCNARARLDVHHRTYEHRGCERDQDVIALCRPCHALHHGKLA
jgi:hypothetical protein